MINHLNQINYLVADQYGFRPGLSMTDAIATLTDQAGNNLNNNKLTLATFIDFRKAFDTLDHSILIQRLTDLNLKRNVLNWFKSYLSDRQQLTIANNIQSAVKPIVTGVPQGSILGPLLFIIYVNGLTSTIKTAKAIMYADDTVVHMAISKKPTIQEIKIYQTELNKICDWCNNNKLSINAAKTKIMILGTNRRTKNVILPTELTINEIPLEITDKYKYLGVTINSQLTFAEHISTCVGIAAGKIRTLTFLKNYIDYKLLIRIYKTSILPILEYANIIDPLIPKHILIKKQRMQNRALRIIFSHLHNESRQELHLKARLATLK